MVDFIILFLGIILLPIALLSIFFALEVMVAALFWSRQREGGDGMGADELFASQADYPLVVLVPAHDEEAVLGATLNSIKAQLGPKDQILVVADNCTDTSAHIAKAAGARVCERAHDTKRGKGYALDYGINQLRDCPPKGVVIIDADCALDDGALDILRTKLLATGRPVQGLYLIEYPNGTELSRFEKLSQFALRVKNHVRAYGLSRLGLPVQLSGSGMAFPWSVISEMPLATGHLAEDVYFGLLLAEKNQGAGFAPQAVIRSHFPSDDQSETVQRRRWVHGHMQIILQLVPRILVQNILRLKGQAAGLALDAAILPLTSFVVVGGVVALGFIIGAALSMSVWAQVWAGVFGSSLLLLLWGLCLAWWLVGRDLIGAKDIFGIGNYMCRRIGVTIKGLLRPEQKWIRTKRTNEKH